MSIIDDFAMKKEIYNLQNTKKWVVLYSFCALLIYNADVGYSLYRWNGVEKF